MQKNKKIFLKKIIIILFSLLIKSLNKIITIELEMAAISPYQCEEQIF